MSSASTQDVTDALRFFIEMSGVYTTDDEGFVVKKTGERISLPGPSGAAGKPVVLYQQPMPRGDFYVINPFAEGLGQNTPPQVFFYKLQRQALIVRIRLAVLSPIMLAMIDKKIPVPEDSNFIEAKHTKTMLDMIGGKTVAGKSIIDEIDDKMFAEVDKFLSSPAQNDHIVDILYLKRQMTSSLKSDIIEDEHHFNASMGIRKKSYQVAQAILMNLLGVKSKQDLARFTAGTMEKAPAKLSSWMTVLFSVYSKFNQVLEDSIDIEWVVDLGSFKMHLDNLPAYSGNAKWMIAPNAPEPTSSSSPSEIPTGAAIPGAVQIPTGGMPTSSHSRPVDPYHIPYSNPPADQQIPEGMIRIPGPIDARGMRLPGELVPTVGGMLSSTGYYGAPQPSYYGGQTNPYQQPQGNAWNPNSGMMPAQAFSPMGGMPLPGTMMPPNGYQQQFNAYGFSGTPGMPSFGIR